MYPILKALLMLHTCRVTYSHSA